MATASDSSSNSRSSNENCRSIDRKRSKCEKSSWAGIVCSNSSDRNGNDNSSNINAKRDSDAKGKGTRSDSVGEPTTDQEHDCHALNDASDNGNNVNSSDSGRESNNITTNSSVSNNDVELIVGGSVSIPTDEVDPSELDQFTVISRTKRDKTKKKTMSMKSYSFGSYNRGQNYNKERVNGCKNEEYNGMNGRYDKVKNGNRTNEPQGVLNGNVNNVSDNSYNLVSVTSNQIAENFHDESRASGNSSSMSESPTPVLETFIPAPVPVVNIWEKRKSVPTPANDKTNDATSSSEQTTTKNTISEMNGATQIEPTASVISNGNISIDSKNLDTRIQMKTKGVQEKASEKEGSVSEEITQTTTSEPQKTLANRVSSSTPTLVNGQQQQQPPLPQQQQQQQPPLPQQQQQQPPLPQQQQQQLPSPQQQQQQPEQQLPSPQQQQQQQPHPRPRVPLGRPQNNISNLQIQPIVVTSRRNLINKEASDFREISDWPTLVEVHQTQEALQLSQAQKANWRKDEKSRKSSDEGVKKKKKETTNGLGGAADDDSGSHDDDSLKENREASSFSNSKSENQNINQKPHKSKTKKGKWKRLDIPPPRRERGGGSGFRRTIDMESRSDFASSIGGRGRGRGAGGLPGRGKGNNSTRGRGRGAGRGGHSGHIGSLYDPLLDYDEMAEYMMPYYMPTAYVPPLFHHLDESILKVMIRQQVEYYFCVANLKRDYFMRRKMDSQGFLPLTLIATFNRMRQLTDDLSLVIAACKNSKQLEVKEDIWVRTVNEPETWPLGENDPIPPELLLSSSVPYAIAFPPTVELPPGIAGLTRPSLLSSSAAVPHSIMNPEVPEFVPEQTLIVQPQTTGEGEKEAPQEAADPEPYPPTRGDNENGALALPSDVTGAEEVLPSSGEFSYINNMPNYYNNIIDNNVTDLPHVVEDTLFSFNSPPQTLDPNYFCNAEGVGFWNYTTALAYYSYMNFGVAFNFLNPEYPGFLLIDDTVYYNQDYTVYYNQTQVEPQVPENPQVEPQVTENSKTEENNVQCTNGDESTPLLRNGMNSEDCKSNVGGEAEEVTNAIESLRGESGVGEVACEGSAAVVDEGGVNGSGSLENDARNETTMTPNEILVGDRENLTTVEGPREVNSEASAVCAAEVVETNGRRVESVHDDNFGAKRATKRSKNKKQRK